ncbi:MAG: Ig-like domain-containing protein, partial [Ekhidna sp.]
FAVVVLNTAPVLAGTGGTLNYTENDGAVPVDPGVIASDNEDLDFVYATIQISNGYEAAEDVLNFTDQLGLTGSYDAGSATMTITGDATVDDYNTAIQSVTYSNSSEDPVESTRTVTFIINDGTVDSNPITRDILVSSVNDPPVLSGTSGSTEYTTETPPFVVNSTFSITDVDNAQMTSAEVFVVQSSNNTFVDGDELSFTNTTEITGSYNSTSGVLTLSGSSSLANYAAALNSIEFEYNPPGTANENTRKISFNVSDGANNSNFINHFITFATSTNFPPEVIEVNGEPVVGAVDLTTNEDSSVEVCLTVNDPDGDLVTVTITTPPTNGTAGTINEVDGEFCFNYTPNADFNGTETIVLQACDALGECNTANVTINIDISPVNDPPVIAPSTVSADEKTTTELCINPADITDIEGDTHEFTSGTSANGGTVVDGTVDDLCFDYTPPTGFIGTDQVEVTICDSNDPTVCSTTTVDVEVVEVNDSPIIYVNGIDSETMTVETFEDSVKVFCFSVVDVDGDNVSTKSIVKVSGNGTLIEDVTEFCYEYTPVPDENGIPSVWEITIEDDGTGNLTDMVTVTLNLTAVNDFPTLADITDPTAIDEDAGEQTVNLSGISAGGGETQALSVTATSSNTALIPDPTVTYTSAEATGSLAYTPVANQSGTAVITVTVNDGQAANNTVSKTFTVTVNAVNDQPTIDDITVDVYENVTSQVCIGVTDVENDSHKYIFGTSLTTGATISNGTDTDLCFYYTPQEGFIGIDEVEITICDVNDPDVCVTDVININVLNVNDAPIIMVSGVPVNSLSVHGLEDTTTDFCFEVIDPDGDELIASVISNIVGDGKLEANGEFCYRFSPELNMFGLSTWQIEVCDNGSPSLCSTIFIDLNITNVNDAPETQPDTLIVMRKERKSINVLSNDFDLDGDNLQLSTTLEKRPIGGTATISQDGTITYFSNANFRGVDSLTYIVEDSGNPSLTAFGKMIIRVDDIPFTIYQTISPNGDGMNDYWHIEGIDYYPNNTVSLFDRYNNLVFEINGYNNEDKVWTGNSNKGSNSTLPEGTYFYRINAGEGGTFGGFVVLRGTEN